jgi:hypothetical protein
MRVQVNILNKLFDDYRSKSIKLHRHAVKIYHKYQQKKLGKPVVLKFPKVTSQVDLKIPKFSWLCRIIGPWYHFIVGSGVEVHDDLVFEGAWDGEFGDHNIERSDYVYGSGAVLRDCIIFVPPKHCCEYLFVLYDKKKSNTYVSNSMNFIFSQINMEHALLAVEFEVAVPRSLMI